MDMFMDKIAQKLNAQDIIRANTVAETDQLNKLKAQTAEYQECLRKMQKLIDDGVSRMEQAGQISSAQDKQLEELKASVSGLEQKIEAMKALLVEEEGKLASAEGKLASAEEKLASAEEKLVTVDEKLAAVDEKLVSVDGKLSAENGDDSALEEYIHKECVKVYKNVQAIVVDGNDKLQGNVTESLKNTAGVRGRATAALVFSVLAFLTAAAGLTLQILNGLNIKLF